MVYVINLYKIYIYIPSETFSPCPLSTHPSQHHRHAPRPETWYHRCGDPWCHSWRSIWDRPPAPHARHGLAQAHAAHAAARGHSGPAQWAQLGLQRTAERWQQSTVRGRREKSRREQRGRKCESLLLFYMYLLHLLLLLWWHCYCVPSLWFSEHTRRVRRKRTKDSLQNWTEQGTEESLARFTWDALRRWTVYSTKS